jgi:Spy/CpxP family protein refolding chaperone
MQFASWELNSIKNKTNKKMKRILTILTALVLSTTVAFAQSDASKEPAKQTQKKTPEQNADAYVNRLEKQLGLTAEQKVKVRELVITKSKKIEEFQAKAKAAGNKDQLKAERQKIKDDFELGMKDVLTPEQYAKWTQGHEKKQEKKAASKTQEKK